MSQDLLASKVVVVEEQPKVRGIASASTSAVAAVGTAADGPLNTPTLCTSFDEYEATFGGFTPVSGLALAAKGFFENGGGQLWVSRVGGPMSAATVDVTQVGEPDALGASVTSTNAPPYSVANGDDLTIQLGTGIDAFSYTLTYSASPAEFLMSLGPYGLSNGQTIEFTVSGAPRSATFTSGQFANIAFATGQEVAAAIVSAIPELEWSDEPPFVRIGTVAVGPSVHLEVTGGTALGVLPLSPGFAVDGSGTVPDLNAITAADVLLGDSYNVEALDVGTGVKLTTVATGSTAAIQILGGSAAPIFGFDSDVHFGVSGTAATVSILHFEAVATGTAGNDLSVEITNASGYDLRLFRLNVYQSGNVVESFDTLSRDPAHDRYVEAVVNDPVTGSQYVRVTNGPNFRKTQPTYGMFPLAGGAGSAADDVVDAAILGNEADGTGLYAFDNVPDVSILIVPGKTSPAIHNAMLTYCEQHRDGTMFAVLDPPANFGATDMVNYVSSTASLENASEYGAIYWPWVKILNPDKGVFGAASQISVAPSGIVAGVYARNDGASPGGVYVQSAGVEAGRMFGVLGFDNEETLNERKRDIVYPHRINPLTTKPGRPRFIDGSRTLKGDGSFPSVAERRGVIFIERSLRQGLQFVRHRNNTPELRAQVRRTITAFLLAQMQNGAFASKEPSKAFFVDVSDQLNTPSVVAAGQLIARVGLATSKPAEYVVIQISQDTRALDAELAGGE